MLIDRSVNDELHASFTTKEIADVIKKLKKQQSMWNWSDQEWIY